MVHFCTKKAPASTLVLIPAHAPEENGRRAREIGSNRSLLKRPDNGLGHAQAAHLLAAGRRCCARAMNCWPREIAVSARLAPIRSEYLEGLRPSLAETLFM